MSSASDNSTTNDQSAVTENRPTQHPKSAWQLRVYPEAGLSTIPNDEPKLDEKSQTSPTASRYDFSNFINSMDDLSFAYFSLIQEYGSRTLQGNALQYAGLYRALVSQKPEDEQLSRCSIVEFAEHGSRSRTFSGYNDLKDYVDASWAAQSQRCLFVLEDLPVRFVCLLGSRMRIHPSVFARHYSTEDSATISDNITSLPSIEEPRTLDGLYYDTDDGYDSANEKCCITLRYPVTMPQVSVKQHPDPAVCPPWLKPSSRLMDQSAYPKFLVERVLDTPSLHDKWDARGEVSELEAQATYWSMKHDPGWTGKCIEIYSPDQPFTITKTAAAVILVDPCLKDPAHLAIIGGEPPFNLSREIRYPELEDHEKAHLAPNPVQWHPSAAFTKYSLHDDIIIHFSVAGSGPGGSPLAVTPFVRGFVISKWVAHLNHISRCFVHTRIALFSSGDNLGSDNEGSIRHTSRWGANWHEWMFESLTRWTTDLVLYRLDAETNMRALGIDVDDPRSYGLVGKREAQMWHFVRSSCQDLQGMFENLANSYTQVVALRETQASNVQASSLRWLTILETFFVPVSAVAGVMSMSGEFLPGEDRF